MTPSTTEIGLLQICSVFFDVVITLVMKTQAVNQKWQLLFCVRVCSDQKVNININRAASENERGNSKRHVSTDREQMSSSAASASATPVNVRKDILDAFWKLSDSKDGARLDAAAKIIESCKVTFKDFIKPLLKGALVTVLRVILQEPSDDEYVLSRLVRGLASDRISARKGFYVALVEYLRRRNDSKLVPRVRELISKHLTPHGGSKGVSILELRLRPEAHNSHIFRRKASICAGNCFAWALS